MLTAELAQIAKKITLTIEDLKAVGRERINYLQDLIGWAEEKVDGTDRDHTEAAVGGLGAAIEALDSA